uniref:Uncharacterized protein n=1 Tax=Arundo donax TaxID=35708 RepID=A0A0A9BQV7_ARUDO
MQGFCYQHAPSKGTSVLSSFTTFLNLFSSTPILFLFKKCILVV